MKAALENTPRPSADRLSVCKNDSIKGEPIITREQFEAVKEIYEYRRKSEANYLFEIVAYVDGMERKLDQVVIELSEVRKQLVELQERQRMKSVKQQLGEAANQIEKYCNKIKEQLFEVKADIKDKTNSIVSEVKTKGKDAFSRVVEFTGVKKVRQY